MNVDGQIHHQPQAQRVRLMCHKDNLRYEITPHTSNSSLNSTPTPSPNKKGPPPPPPPRADKSNNIHRSPGLQHKYGSSSMTPSGQVNRHTQAADLLNQGSCGCGNCGAKHNSVLEIIDSTNKSGVTTTILPSEKKKFDVCGDNYVHVDRFFLVAMPMLFLAFNIVYWMSYGSHFFIEKEEEKEDNY